MKYPNRLLTITSLLFDVSPIQQFYNHTAATFAIDSSMLDNIDNVLHNFDA